MWDFHNFGLIFVGQYTDPQRLNFFEWSGPEGASEVKKFFRKTLILAFEVIVQPPETHFFDIFKSTKTHYGGKR